MGTLSPLFQNNERTKNNSKLVRTTAGTSLMATAEEEQAVADFKMISEDESQLRRIGGIILGIITITKFLTTSGIHDYSGLSLGSFLALSTYRTGIEYQ